MYTFRDPNSTAAMRLTALDAAFDSPQTPFELRWEYWNPETLRYEINSRSHFHTRSERDAVMSKQLRLVRAFFPTFQEKIESIR